MRKYKQGLLNRLRDTRIYRSSAHVRSHPIHVTAALAMMGQGFVFITSYRFFDWPPFLAHAENDNSVGTIFIAVGLFLMIWAFDKKVSDFWETVLLSIGAFLQLTLSLIDFFSWINDGILTGNSHGTIGAFTIFAVIMLAASTRKRVIGRERK